MEQSPEDLGLCSDISRLPSEVRCLIRDGNRDGCPSYSETAVKICAAIFWAGFGVDEVWMVSSDPANVVSKMFFSQDGEQAEDYLEQPVSEADEAQIRSREKCLSRAAGVSCYPACAGRPIDAGLDPARDNGAGGPGYGTISDQVTGCLVG